MKKLKKTENAAYARFSARLAAAFSSLRARLQRLGVAGRQKLTIMFIPHTEKKIFNVQLSFFALAGIACAVALVVIALVFSATRFSGTAQALRSRSDDLAATQADLDAFRDSTGRLVTTAKRFETALSGTLSRIGVKPSSKNSAAQQGDLGSFFETEETGSGEVREIGEIGRVTDFLEKAIEPVKEAGSLFKNQSAILTEIPNIWPVKGGIGHISMYYGQNENPFTGQWYIHKGLDISTFRSGDPIVATADGKVITVSYDSGFGNYVIIQHGHGFYTRYAHMQSFRVYKGQKIQQGQVIGYVGNTGLSTGPHVHYEVHLGTGVIDPLKFLNIKSSAAAAAD